MKKAIGLMLLAGTLMFGAKAPQISPLENRIRHELVMLPFFTIYDDLSFQVDQNGNVVLTGSVIRPTLKSSAENVVKKVEGVGQVDNRIEVLPLSPFDDNIRLRVARAVYGAPALNRYALGAQPPIRIIVKNGNVTLKGFVNNEGDKNIAGIRANGVSGVFSVKNELQIDRS